MSDKEPLATDEQILQAAKTVYDLADEIVKLMTERLKQYDGRSHWLMRGRLLQMLFSWHFGIAVNLGKETIEKEQVKQDDERRTANPS